MLCEMCGEEVPLTTRVRVEGSVLRLCPSCARFGTPVDPPVPAPTPEIGSLRGPVEIEATLHNRLVVRSRRLEERDLFTELPELELAADWPRRIRGAREKLNWTPEELGKRLNEKHSVVLKLETGAFRPPDELVRRIEKLLKIRLRAEPTEAAGQ